MNFIKFDEFIESNGLAGQDDEAICMSLLQALAEELKPRVIIENFPQNLY